MSTLWIAAIVMGVLALVLGTAIGIFVKFFKVDRDPRIELVLELLPGANCGGCGRAGCADFAKAVVAGEVQPFRCPVSSREQVNAIAFALGVDPGDGFARRAVVCCSGDNRQTQMRKFYNGTIDCAAASMIGGGPKGCRYGCIGMGNCAHACPFGAIEVINSLAVVHQEICVGCGKCVDACPRGVIKLVPAQSEAHVYCNSPEKGAVKRSLCHGGCIGCGKCEKAFPAKFKKTGFLARVDYEAEELPTAEDVAQIKCPTGALATETRHYEAEKVSSRGGNK
ncbi:MAG: RnfABCDGE type electron transport complex subunit B [Victivallaceae bacterium]|nr:RnfABCDGE type electron transport complex subunit B [Victivallaceae bacterium]